MNFLHLEPLTDDWGFEAELRSLAYQWNSTQYTTMLLQSTIVRSMLDQSENNFTLILPTDHAYHSLPERMRQRIQDELDRRTNLLQYHVLSGLDLLNQSQAFNRLSAESGVPLFYTNLTQLHQITNQSFRPSTSSSTPNTAFSSTRAHLPSFNVIPSTASADQAEAARLLAKIDQINRSPGHASVSGSLILSAKLLPVFRTRPSHSVLPYATPRARYVLVLSVDRVLYPPRNSVFDMVTAAPMLSTLADLLRVSGLASALQSDLRPLTLFAPSNNAFNQLGQATLDQLRRNPETTRGTQQLPASSSFTCPEPCPAFVRTAAH